MNFVSLFTTGSRRGYVKVNVQGKESELKEIPESIKGLKGNFRKAMKFFKNEGCTHYTITDFQGVPFKGNSNQYCYSEYRGYKI